MDLRKLARKVIVTTVATGLCGLSLSATASTCFLNENCVVPNTDGASTRVAVTPATGVSYVCDVTSTGGRFTFFVSGGGHFSVVNGFGLHSSNPTDRIYVSGFFKYPYDVNDQGAIKVTPLSRHHAGVVSCHQL